VGYTTLQAYAAATHRETSSSCVDGWSFAKLFVDAAHYNYAMTHGTPTPTPTALPKNVAQALGTSTTVSHVGA
jgi:hypothetical protein